MSMQSYGQAQAVTETERRRDVYEALEQLEKTVLATSETLLSLETEMQAVISPFKDAEATASSWVEPGKQPLLSPLAADIIAHAHRVSALRERINCLRRHLAI